LIRTSQIKEWFTKNFGEWDFGARFKKWSDSEKQIIEEANKFKSEITAVPDRDYKWVCQYAKEHWSRLDAAFHRHDDKADSIVKLLGTSLFAFGALLYVNRHNAHILLAATPAVLFALIAIGCALAVRLPRTAALPPSIKGAWEYCNYFNEQAEATFIGQWHKACEMLRNANEKKASLLTASFICSIIAIAVMSLPIAVAVVSPPDNAPQRVGR